MRVGAVFPQIEIGADAGAIRAYATGIEQVGFDHVLVYDHVLGADPEAYDLSGPYTIDDTFHEPFALFGYLAGITDLELVTGVIVLPQRQTALVAKQAAQVDIFSGGRLRLGVGIGWNWVEYDALGMDFRTRGRRMEEQIALLRAFWTQRRVDFEGTFDTVRAAGISPLPVQRPIPVWIGSAGAPRALERVGRVADGWMPQLAPGPKLDELLAIVHGAAVDAGREPADLGLEGRITVTDGDLNRVAREAAGWRAVGATHVSVNTMRAGHHNVDDHLAALVDIIAAIKG